MEMRVYVGTYAKYNNGSIYGAWLALTDYADRDEFIEVCLELHKDETDPELMFQDWEGIPDNLISECTIHESVWELMDAFNEHGREAVVAYIEEFGEWGDSAFRDRYHGEYESWEAMATELLEDTGELDDIPERLRYYFDYDKYARDIRLGGDMSESGGHFFWNH